MPTISLLMPAALLLCQTTLPAGFIETFDDHAADRWRAVVGRWTFAPGAARQSEAAFDCLAVAAEAAASPEASFFFAVRFKPDSSFNGGGLVFALPQLDRKDGGMLVRCDPGGRILWGRFDAWGEFEYAGDVRIADPGTAEQELAVAVDPDNLAFNVYHNGTRVATNVATNVAAGFVGLQSSGGPHTFVRCELRAAKVAELDGIHPGGNHSRILDLVGNSRRLVALRAGPKFLVTYDEDGSVGLRAYVAEVRGIRGPELAPVALASDSVDAWGSPVGVYVLAERGTAIYHFDAMLHQIGDGPCVRHDAMRGTALAVGPGGYLFVADAALPGLRVFDPAGTERLAYGQRGTFNAYDLPVPERAGLFGRPNGIAAAPDGRVFATDRENHTYVVYRYDATANQLQWVTHGPWLPNPSSIRIDRQGRLLLAGPHEYYAPRGALRVMTADGLPINVFTGHALGGLSSDLHACEGPGGRYFLSDGGHERVLLLPPEFIEKLPAFEWLDEGGVRLTITKVDGSPAVATSAETRATDGRALVRQLEPVCAAWPAVPAESLPAYALPAKPPAGHTYVIDMPVRVAVFTRARDESGRELKVPSAGLAARLARELERVRRFYYINSRAILNLQIDVLVIDEVEVTVAEGWVPPADGRRVVNEAREGRGLPPLGPDESLVVIHPLAGFDAAASDDEGVVGGGGLTDWAYSGYALWNHGQAWLLAHEWGHQLDMYFERSGMFDWWLNHPDGTVHVGRFGEHWDCNAFLCRRADRMNWLRLAYGTLRAVADADGDGLPDADASLPLDEQRFGSDPAKVDTDNDGLDDLRELMAGPFRSADPTKADSDADGVPDLEDPYPAFAVNTNLPAVAPAAEAAAPTLEAFARIGAMSGSGGEAFVAGAYDKDHLHLLVALTGATKEVVASVDFNNDGWFVGRDNVTARARLEWPAGTPPVLRRVDGGQGELLGALTAPVAGLPAGMPVSRLAVPRPAGGRPLEPGVTLGLCLRLHVGEGTATFLIDPWRLLELTAR